MGAHSLWAYPRTAAGGTFCRGDVVAGAGGVIILRIVPAGMPVALCSVHFLYSASLKIAQILRGILRENGAAHFPGCPYPQALPATVQRVDTPCLITSCSYPLPLLLRGVPDSLSLIRWLYPTACRLPLCSLLHSVHQPRLLGQCPVHNAPSG